MSSNDGSWRAGGRLGRYNSGMARSLQRLIPQGSSMGVTYVTVSLSNLAKDAAPFEEQFLVDTGAVDCLAPRDKLVAAGIRPEGKKVYELADGKPIELEYGFARVSFLGNETVAQVIFGAEGVEPLRPAPSSR